VLRLSFLLLLVLLCQGRVEAFSLLGPIDAYANLANDPNWPVPRIGYNVFNTDIGVPVNLGEEYRWNVPTVTYAFDSSFLNYFGQQGVNAIEGAIRILNNLPPAARINLDDFPTENKRLNATAQNLGIMDMKSTALSLMLELFGLAAPERFVYTLRDRTTRSAGGVTFTNYLVINRNFDPVTLQPTNRVNGASYGYLIDEFNLPVDWADAFEFQLDPLEFGYSSVAGALSSAIYNVDLTIVTIGGTNFFGRTGGLLPGELFPGLTRDDAGGWRYLLRRPNWNVEQAPTNATFDLAVLAGITNRQPQPWTPIFVNTNLIATNIFNTNFPPWTPFVPATNVVTNVFGTNITNIIINIALRPGIEKINFRRVDFDSLLGSTFNFTNRWTDTVISNFSRVTQRLQEVQTQPDLLFAAGDLGADTDSQVITLRRGVVRVNNDTVNGFVAQGGPGILQGPMLIQFSDVLPAIEETHGPNSLFVFPGLVWGSFTESPDDIIVFPNSLSLAALEELLRRRLQ
jgi:hypothetical protein